MSVADKLQTIAENESKVYAAGQKAEHDKFWDTYQRNGNRTDYPNLYGAFSGYSFDFDNFYPKYDICPEGSATQLFYGWTGADGNYKGSLKQRLNECGVVLDTSKATMLSQAFNWTNFTELPTISFASVTSSVTNEIRNVFSNNGKLETIEKIIVTPNTYYVNWFENDTNLKNVVFEGVIGQNGINLQWSNNLTIDSLRSIISCLKDYSADTSGTVWKVKVGSTNYAKLTDEDLQNIITKGWVFE